MKQEAVKLARTEHNKLHMHCNVLQNQLLNKFLSPFLDTSITTVILRCKRCKNFSSAHLHSLLAPITHHRAFKLLIGDYLSMPAGKGSYTKIGLYANVFSQKLWAFKLKSAKEKDTVNSLHSIVQNFTAPSTIMADGSSHFNCKEVKTYCDEIGMNLHITAAYSLWINGLLEGSNGILLNALKWLCTPNLGEDDYKQMRIENIPKNWPDHLNTTIKHLSDCILPALKFLPNELLLGIPTTIHTPINPDSITPSIEADATLHLAIRDQQQFDRYTTIFSHAERGKKRYNNKVMRWAPGNNVFEKDNLTQQAKNPISPPK